MKNVKVLASCSMDIPDSAKIIYTKDNEPIGIELKDGTQLFPVVGLDLDDGNIIVSDTDFKNLGISITEYHDTTGVVPNN